MKRRHWALAGAGLACAGYLAFRKLSRGPVQRLGSTLAETGRRLPGDDLLPEAVTRSTLAVAVQAPADHVWPWLVQMGTGRAGWYSYDLAGEGSPPSATRILLEHQDLSEGDVIPVLPDGSIGLRVARLDPERALVLEGFVDARTGEEHPLPGPLDSFTWALVLEPLGEDRTRLTGRLRVASRSEEPLGGALGALVGVGHFVLQRKQLLEVKKRAEVLAGANEPEPDPADPDLV